jgi:hypothetical protein
MASPEETQDSSESKERHAFLLRLQPELFEELRAWASQDLRSLNAHIEFLLREALKKRRGGKSG